VTRGPSRPLARDLTAHQHPIVDKRSSVVDGAMPWSSPLSPLRLGSAPFMQPLSPNEAFEYIGRVGLGLEPDTEIRSLLTRLKREP
jgi:hypothetical protein